MRKVCYDPSEAPHFKKLIFSEMCIDQESKTDRKTDSSHDPREPFAAELPFVLTPAHADLRNKPIACSNFGYEAVKSAWYIYHPDQSTFL